MLSEKDLLTLNTPATEWRDAWPAGNGTVGALVFGDVRNETVILNHEACWLYGTTGNLPDVSDSLKEVRRLMGTGEYQRAHDYYRDRLKEVGYTPQMSSFSPVAALKVTDDSDNGSGSEEYSRRLDMSSGETSVSWRQRDTGCSRRLFASREDGRIHYLLESTGVAGMDLDVRLLPLDGDADRTWMESNGLEFECITDGGRLILRGRDGAGRLFGATVLIAARDGESRSEDGRIRISGATSVRMEIAVFADADPEDFDIDWSSSGYAEAMEGHQTLHSALYDRVKLRLLGEGAESVRAMFDYGRYLMIAGSGGDLPPNLQGLWNGDILPIWNCFYMLNENIQMMHWQALPGNLPEFLFPMFDFYESRMEDFRENARKLFGCRGIFIPANITPDSGLLTDLQGHLIHWVSGAAWLARFYYDYYLYTGDEAFLKDRALPIMRETALFFEDYLYENAGGELEFCPSVSPENAPEEFNRLRRMDAMCNVTVNATMDVALCRELLTNLLSTLEICGIDAPEKSAWVEMKAKLPAYAVNSDGAVREWLHDGFTDNYHHRHQSHIYPFFPGSEIRTGDELIPAIECAVEKRLCIGLKEQTGWSMVHLANIYARLGRGDRALECLDILRDYCTGVNLFTYHNDWRERGVCETKPRNFDKRVFQIDANLGYPAAIMEMLCWSMPGEIRLLPGLPSNFPEGGISGLVCRGGIELSMDWTPEGIAFTLTSSTDCTVAISFPATPENLTAGGEDYDGDLSNVTLELTAGKPLECRAAVSILPGENN